MDLPSWEPFEIDDFESLEDAPTETDVDEHGSHVADLVELAQYGFEDKVFAAFPLLAESDQCEMCTACEHLQVHHFMRDLRILLRREPGLCWEQKLNFFRLAQRIRGEHGITFENSPPERFQSFEDILELERDIEINNGVEFVIHCTRSNLIDGRYFRLMFKIASTVEQLAAIYDESVRACKRYLRPGSSDFQDFLGLEFQFSFRNLTRARPCKRPLWRDMKIYFERAGFFFEKDMFASDVGKTNLDGELSCLLSDSALDEALSCLLSNARLFGSDDPENELAHLTKSLLSRGASLYYRDQHGVSSLGRLLGLSVLHVEWRLETLSTYICCPLRTEGGKIIADNRRPAPLTCLAARRIPPSTIEEHITSLLRPFVRGHQELHGILTGSIRCPEPVDEWRHCDQFELDGLHRYNLADQFLRRDHNNELVDYYRVLENYGD